MRTLYADALTRQGFQIRTAEDGMSALRALELFEPDVLVLDLRLPLADGFDVVRELRRDSARAHLPIIAVSGYDTGLAAARRDPAFFAALQKPFDPDELIDVVRRATSRSRPELL